MKEQNSAIVISFESKERHLKVDLPINQFMICKMMKQTGILRLHMP
jgi:hypothetical protein